MQPFVPKFVNVKIVKSVNIISRGILYIVSLYFINKKLIPLDNCLGNQKVHLTKSVFLVP
jgi:hypothetical protein